MTAGRPGTQVSIRLPPPPPPPPPPGDGWSIANQILNLGMHVEAVSGVPTS